MSLLKEKNYLLSILAKQDYSRKQLNIKLNKRAKISETQIKSLLDEFEEKRWLSDKRFIEVFVSNEIAKFRGRKRILNTAVYQKGLSQEQLEKYLDNLDINWLELCKKCLNKKYKNTQLLDNINLKQKAKNYLIYNGFSYDQICGVMNENT